VFMSVSRLHSFRFIWTCGKCSGLCMYLVSFDCNWQFFFFDYVIVIFMLLCDVELF
jgi:hypothetical protein